MPYNQLAIGAIPLVVRTKIDPEQLIVAVKNAVQGVDAEVAVSRVRTMQHVLVSSQGERRFTLFLLVIFVSVSRWLRSESTRESYGVQNELERSHRRAPASEMTYTATLGRTVGYSGLGMVCAAWR